MILCEIFEEDIENRRKMRGKKLADFVMIYRGCHQSVTTFKPMDYVTRSLKFATEHAAHMMAVEDQPYHVIKTYTQNVYEAPNTNEYFYDGPELKGKIAKSSRDIETLYESDFFESQQYPKQYPKIMDSDDVCQFVFDQGDYDDDWFDGPLPEWIREYPRYVLQEIPLPAAASENQFDPVLAKEYAAIDGSIMPPIVFDGERQEIIDGNHRVQAAVLRGDTSILAYVGKNEKKVP